MKVVGVMSGTSMDGTDAALLEIGNPALGAPPGRPPDADWSLLAFRSDRYRDDQREQIRCAIEEGGAEEICELHGHLALAFADTVARLLSDTSTRPDEVAAIGSHGHALWHAPPNSTRLGRGTTLQVGDPATLASATGIPVVSDFRQADMAAWGQGAPLVPWPDRFLFARPGEALALQNLGGIGNVTLLAPRESDEPPFAFDTGPGNVLLDIAAERVTDGAERFDEDGRLASRGEPDENVVRELLGMSFFDETPPRSTGRELFGPALVDRLITERGLDGPDLLATLTLLTARSIGEAYRNWVLRRGVDRVVLTGGGAKNGHLVRLLREELPDLPIEVGADALGMDPDAREAAAFAVLAWAYLHGIPASVPEATGARGPRILGSFTPAPDRSADRRVRSAPDP